VIEKIDYLDCNIYLDNQKMGNCTSDNSTCDQRKNNQRPKLKQDETLDVSSCKQREFDRKLNRKRGEASSKYVRIKQTNNRKLEETFNYEMGLRRLHGIVVDMGAYTISLINLVVSLKNMYDLYQKIYGPDMGIKRYMKIFNRYPSSSNFSLSGDNQIISFKHHNKSLREYVTWYLNHHSDDFIEQCKLKLECNILLEIYHYQISCDNIDVVLEYKHTIAEAEKTKSLFQSLLSRIDIVVIDDRQI
jgi:hypothetical protein